MTCSGVQAIAATAAAVVVNANGLSAPAPASVEAPRWMLGKPADGNWAEPFALSRRQRASIEWCLGSLAVTQSSLS